jgi:hypothetical protein
MTDEWPPAFVEPKDAVHHCRHPKWKRRLEAGRIVCGVCTKEIDPAAMDRGRRAARRGKDIQRRQIVGLGGKNLPGNNPNHDGQGIMFSYESKSGPAAFSERAWRWLTQIPATALQTKVLIVTEKPGPGKRARAYVVVEYGAWRDLHGELRDDEAAVPVDPYTNELAGR